MKKRSQQSPEPAPTLSRFAPLSRLAVILLLGSASLAPAQPSEDVQLRRLLGFFKAIHIGDSYEAVKKVVPEIGALGKDAGDNNTEALMTAKVGQVRLKGEFNFAQGRLVSHGLGAETITHAQGHDLFLRCVAILNELYGESERRIELPSESDGPDDSIGISFGWAIEQTAIGLDLNYRRTFASVRWGAQGK